jgi:hypothetical protein
MKTPAQDLIITYLKNHPEGVLGACRIVQEAHGYTYSGSIGTGDLLDPLYALVNAGKVQAIPNNPKKPWRGQVCTYILVKQ